MIGVAQVGLHHFNIAGIQGRASDHAFSVFLEAKRGKDRLKDRSGTVIQRRIDRFKSGELRHHALVDPLRDQGSLAPLGLIGSVGGRKLAV